MLNHFNVSSYCAITATPFANVLIDSENRNDDVGSDLFPRSFIWTLDKPTTYMGVKEIVTDRFKDITLVEGPDRQDENRALANSILGFKINHKKVFMINLKLCLCSFFLPSKNFSITQLN